MTLASDVEMEKHQNKIETEMYILYINLAQNHEEVLDLAKRYARDKKIHSMILCPRFDHEEIAEISEAVGEM